MNNFELEPEALKPVEFYTNFQNENYLDSIETLRGVITNAGFLKTDSIEQLEPNMRVALMLKGQSPRIHFGNILNITETNTTIVIDRNKLLQKVVGNKTITIGGDNSSEWEIYAMKESDFGNYNLVLDEA